MPKIKNKKPFVFMGAKMFSPQETKPAMIAINEIIEKACRKNGYQIHPHLLTNPDIYEGANVDVTRVKLGMKSFAQIIKELDKNYIKRIAGHRMFESHDNFNRSVAAAREAFLQVWASCAGIFNLTEESTGSLILIGELLAIPAPVLCVSRSDNFGAMLSGHPSDYLTTKIFETDKELVEAVDIFLKKVTDMSAINPISFKPPHNLLMLMKREMAEKNISMTKLIVESLKKRYA